MRNGQKLCFPGQRFCSFKVEQRCLRTLHHVFQLFVFMYIHVRFSLLGADIIAVCLIFECFDCYLWNWTDALLWLYLFVLFLCYSLLYEHRVAWYTGLKDPFLKNVFTDVSGKARGQDSLMSVSSLSLAFFLSILLACCPPYGSSGRATRRASGLVGGWTDTQTIGS